MITKIERWKTEDGKEFNSELEALRYENEILRTKLYQNNWFKQCQQSLIANDLLIYNIDNFKSPKISIIDQDPFIPVVNPF